MREEIRAEFAAYNRRRRTAPSTCVVCGLSIPVALTIQRYCSQVCKQRAYRQRVKERQGEG